MKVHKLPGTAFEPRLAHLSFVMEHVRIESPQLKIVNIA